MNQDINLNLYKVFYWVATLSSFKKASDKLCVSQPAISKQIKNLEEILGVKLFFRLNKGIKLTKEGLMLLEQVEKMNFYLEASVKYISSSKHHQLSNQEFFHLQFFITQPNFSIKLKLFLFDYRALYLL